MSSKDNLGDLTIVRVRGVGTVIRGLDKIFLKARQIDFEKDEDMAGYLLDSVKKLNRIPSRDEKDLANVLVKKFKSYLDGREKEDDDEDKKSPRLDIRILGGCCSNCFELEKEAMAAVVEMGIEGPFLTISDPELIAEYGIVPTPALVINGKVVTKGRVVLRDEIKRLIKEALEKEGKK